MLIIKLKNNLYIIVPIIVLSSIILFLILRPEPKFTIFEKKIGDIVRSDNYLLRVIDVQSLLGNTTQIHLAIRNISHEPIRILVTDRTDRSDDLHYKKYYFVIERNKKIYSTCCQNHLIEPCDDSGPFDSEFTIYFSGHLKKDDNCFLLIARDVGRYAVGRRAR